MQRPLLGLSVLIIPFLLAGRAWRFYSTEMQNAQPGAQRVSAAMQSSPLTSPLVPAVDLFDSPLAPVNDSPLPTATVTPRPTPQVILAKQLPPVSHDLLFLNKGALQRWNHQTGQIERLLGPETTAQVADQHKLSFRLGPGPLTGSVIEYAASRGPYVAVLVWRRVAPTENLARVQALVYNLETQATIRLTTDSEGASWVTVSPDGQWIAWGQQPTTSVAARAPGLAAQLPLTTTQWGSSASQIYLAPIHSPENAMQVGMSHGNLRSGKDPLFWSADSQHLLWLGEGGVWRLTVADSSTPDFFGFEAVVGELISVSPTGRALMAYQYGQWEGSSWAVAHLESGRVMSIPGSFEHSRPNARAIWIEDDHFFLTRPYSVTGEPTAWLEIWQVAPSAPELLQLERSVPISSTPRSFPTALTQVDEQVMRFLLLNQDRQNPHVPGIYQYNRQHGTLRQLNGFPVSKEWASGQDLFSEEAYWLPDGSGLLYKENWYRQIFYVPVTGDRLYDITYRLGEESCCYTWLQGDTP
jgi:hypothetical protein